jgi:hypothetical protein
LMTVDSKWKGKSWLAMESWKENMIGKDL